MRTLIINIQLNICEIHHMETDRSTELCHLLCQINYLLFCSLTGIRRCMKIYCINLYSTLRDHMAGYRAVNTAGKKQHCSSIGSDRHTASTFDSLGIYIDLITDFHRNGQLRIMYIHTGIWKFIQNTSTYFRTYFHRSNRVRFSGPAGIYLKGSAIVRMAILHIRNNVFCHLFKALILIDHNRTDSYNTEHSLKSFHSLLIIILFRAKYIDSSLFLFYLKFSFYL